MTFKTRQSYQNWCKLFKTATESEVTITHSFKNLLKQLVIVINIQENAITQRSFTHTHTHCTNYLPSRKKSWMFCFQEKLNKGGVYWHFFYSFLKRWLMHFLKLSEKVVNTFVKRLQSCKFEWPPLTNSVCEKAEVNMCASKK